MKQILLRISISLLTFIIGVTLVSSYQTILQYYVKLSREAELRKELLLMRGAIRQYFRDKRSTPKSLNQLVEEGYLREIPVDPMTGKRDWEERIWWDCLCICVPRHMFVNSASHAVSSGGMPYNDW